MIGQKESANTAALLSSNVPGGNVIGRVEDRPPPVQTSTICSAQCQCARNQNWDSGWETRTASFQDHSDYPVF